MNWDSLCFEMLQGSVDPIILTDETGKIIMANRATVSDLLYDKDELIGKNMSMLIPDHEPEADWHSLKMNFYSGQPSIIGRGREVVAYKRNGATFFAHLTISQIKIDEQTFFLGILRNIETERRVRDQLVLENQIYKLLNRWFKLGNKCFSKKIEDMLNIILKIDSTDMVVFTPNPNYPNMMPLETVTAHHRLFKVSENVITDALEPNLAWNTSHTQPYHFTRSTIDMHFPSMPGFIQHILLMPVEINDDQFGSIAILNRNDSNLFETAEKFLSVCAIAWLTKSAQKSMKPSYAYQEIALDAASTTQILALGSGIK